MKEKEYQIIGWGIFALTLIIAFSWCLNESGLTGWLIKTGENLIKVRLVQISWLVTILVIALPGYMVKRYFENLAWNEHLKNYPRPNIYESAKKSKYIQVDGTVAAQPAKAVEVNSLPKGQEEFIATCVHCGHFFSAKKSTTALKCPQCNETIQLDT